MSPLHPPTLPSSSDFEQSDEEEKEENQAICYSPANVDFTLDSESDVSALPSSPAMPLKKRAKLCQSELSDQRLCCDKDLKMLWLKFPSYYPILYLYRLCNYIIYINEVCAILTCSDLFQNWDTYF